MSVSDKAYIVATTKPWNIRMFHERIKSYPGQWHLLTDAKELTPEKVSTIAPRYIFFPHWSHLVRKEILDLAECVCFHETDLPYGRGGSPIQNLIVRGHKETKISAIQMVEGLDEGPIYGKKRLSLEGGAEEIFLRASKIVAEMILSIVEETPQPRHQQGEPVVFKRRAPEQSLISEDIKTLEDLFDFIRMLDAEEYPRAFLQHGDFRLELSRPCLRTDAIEADVRMTIVKK